MRGTPNLLRDFRGGLNTKAAPFLVGPTECRDCLNVQTTVRGSVRKRGGNVAFTTSGLLGSTASFVTIFPGQNVPTAGNVMMGIDEDGILYSITTGGVATERDPAVALDSRSAIVQAPVSGGQGPIYISSTTNQRQWTGGAVDHAAWTATTGTVPPAKFMVYFKNRIWSANTTANPSRLFFSGFTGTTPDPRVWPTANTVDFGPEDGDGITGLGTIGPYLIVFKATKCWIVYDLDTGANRPLSTAVGCPAPRSIVETPGNTYFLSLDKGVYRTNGKKLEEVSDNITPTIDGIAAAQRVNACGAYFNDRYFLSICATSGSANNQTLEFDIENHSWWKHSNFANQFAVWRPTDQAQLYSARPDVGQIDRIYDPLLLSDFAGNMTTTWQGPWLTFNEPYRNKRMRQIHIDGTGTVDAYIAKDYAFGDVLMAADIFNGATFVSGGGGVFGGAGIFGDAGQTRRRLFTQGVARAYSLRINAVSTAGFEMDAYTPMYTLRQN